ncbi:pyruvate decarboxylase [Emydomyces testavorans]|uniref:Pyruvate decarboxylase n=1 Tax=Emydomyces testavorans TaxID=2070801 RepID=A0AAF0DAK5_9EURO|nr:pyruvate decarboxylase [Emydomyces testavorans]
MAMMKSATSSHPEIDRVVLQVGEQRYSTTIGTLKERSDYFKHKLSGIWPVEEQEDGSIFVDGDPDAFDYVMRYLRRGVFPLAFDVVKGHDYALYCRILEEAKYFQCSKLITWLKDELYYKCITRCTLTDTQEELPSLIEDSSTWNLKFSSLSKADNKVYVCPRGIYLHRGKPQRCGRQCRNAQGDDDPLYDTERITSEWLVSRTKYKINHGWMTDSGVLISCLVYTQSAFKEHATMTKGHQIPVSEYLFRRLHQLGIRHVFGVPGDFNLNLLDHIYNVPDMRWVGTCNELNAAYAADGYARTRGIPGAVVTTYGVGELSAINGIAGAFSEYVPVIHIVGNTPRDMQRNHVRIHHTLWMDKWDHTTYQKMSEPVQSDSAFITDPAAAPEQIDRVIETCVKTRLPVYLFIPLDVQDLMTDSSRLSTPLDLEVCNEGKETQEDEVISEIVCAIDQASNPSVIVDMLVQRHGLVKEAKELIEEINAPAYITPMGKSIINESDPHFAGLYAGIVSSPPNLQAQAEAHDIILHIGPFPVSANTGGFSTNLPADKVIKLHPSYCSVGNKVWDGLNFRPVVKKLVQKLRKHPLKRKANPLPNLQSHTEGPQVDDSCAEPLDHKRFWSRLSKYLQPDDFVIAEVGTSQFGSLDLNLPDNCEYYSQLYYSCIGFTVPALLGTLLARKEMGVRGRVILLVGDGSLQVTVQEIGTIIREGLTPTIFVVNNAGYSIERLIHGPMQQYNDISTQWDHQKMLAFFGAPNAPAFVAKTYAELGKVLNDEEFKKGDRIQLLEVFFDMLDSPWNLTALLELKEKRLRAAAAAATAANGN